MKVGIIGAGYSGLYTANQFSANPDWELTILEQQSQVGGLWCYTPKTGKGRNGAPLHPSVYETLRTHIPRQLMALPNCPVETGKHLPTYIHHTEVLKYLSDYAERFDLLKYIKFDRTVKSIKRVEGGDPKNSQWQVTCVKFNPDNADSDGEKEIFVFDKLVVCTGNHSLADLPNVPGKETFPGEILHSHDYRNNARFQGKAVLLAGAGLSGVDLAHEIEKVATSVVLVNPRRPQLVNCKNLKNTVEEQGYVDRIEGKTVHVSNGKSFDVDAIVFCTGYRLSDHLFDPNCEITYENRRLMPFYKFLVHAKYPSLAVVSFLIKAIPTLAATVQVQFLKKLWEGRFQLPSEEDMIADAEAEYQRRLNMGLSPHLGHFMFGRMQFRYIEQLNEIADIAPLPPYKEKLMMYALEIGVENPEHFRDIGVTILDENDYELYPESEEILEKFRK